MSTVYSIEEAAALGNSAIYFAIPGSGANINKFYDFTGLAWVTPITADCKVLATESSSDGTYSIYQAAVTVPSGGPYIISAYMVSTGERIGTSMTAGTLAVTPPTAVEIRQEMDSNSTVFATLVTLAGRFTGITSLINIIRTFLRSDTADATALSEINSGGGAYSESNMSAQALAAQGSRIESRVSNMGLSELVSTTLRDMVQAPSGDSWLEVEVNIIDAGGAKFDPADTTRPSTTSVTELTIGTGSTGTIVVDSGCGFIASQAITITNDPTHYMTGTVTSYSGTSLVVNVTSVVGVGTFSSWDIALVTRNYNGVGAIFEAEDGSTVVMYRDDQVTPLTSVAMCHHTSQANKPQLIPRVSAGYYRFWVNRTADGNALPLGQLKMKLGYFNIAQADAVYGSSHITDTTPTSSHMDITYAVNVAEDLGMAGIAAQITGVQNTLNTNLDAKSSDILAETQSHPTLGEMIAGGIAVEANATSNKEEVISAVNAGGLGGAYTVSVQFYLTATTTPIPDVYFDVWNSTETVKMNGFPILSDSLGRAYFLRNAGTYKVRAVKAGYTIATGTVVVGTSDTTLTVYGTTSTIPVPGNADSCTVAMYCFRQDSTTPMETVNAKAAIINLPFYANGKYHTGQTLPGTYNATTGLLYFILPQGASVDFDIKYISDKTMHKTIPALSTVLFENLPA